MACWSPGSPSANRTRRFVHGPVKAKPQEKDNAFAIRFFGEIDVPRDGVYRFWTASNDGSVLRIDGKIVSTTTGCTASPKKTWPLS